MIESKDLHVSSPGNLDFSPEKSYLDLALRNVKKGCGGQEQARYGVLWLEGGPQGETIGLMTLPPVVLLIFTFKF